MSAQLETAFKQAVDGKEVPAVGAIALDKLGNELFKAACGHVGGINDSSTLFKTDTCLLIFSCTKLITSVAALQLIEQGKLGLYDLVEKWVPSIKDIKVYQGLDKDRKPTFREPKSKPTVLNLITHTSGLSYDFFDHECLEYRLAVGESPLEYVVKSDLANYKTPFHFDPGADYRYGVNTDYLGWCVEAASGEKLQDYFKDHIFQPLGMKNTGLGTPPGKDFLIMHLRDEDGKLTPVPAINFNVNAEVIAGGHFVTSTIDDYSQFMLALLNNGTHPNGTKILEAKTCDDMLFKDFIPEICTNKQVGLISASIPQASNDGEFMPGVEKGWSCGLMLNNEDVPQGRRAGSGAWAGLGNLYYWIDRKSGKLGLIASAIFPFLDMKIMHLFDSFERTVYGHQMAKTPGEKGSNFRVDRAIEATA